MLDGCPGILSGRPALRVAFTIPITTILSQVTQRVSVRPSENSPQRGHHVRMRRGQIHLALTALGYTGTIRQMEPANDRPELEYES